MRPWAEHSCCFARVFLVLLVISTKLLHGQTLNHATFDVYGPKTAETLQRLSVTRALQRFFSHFENYVLVDVNQMSP